MKQIVNIKKVSIDSDLKVTVQLEFTASDKTAKENIFKLIQMQGEAVEITIEQAQLQIPEKTETHVEVFPL